MSKKERRERKKREGDVTCECHVRVGLVIVAGSHLPQFPYPWVSDGNKIYYFIFG